MQPSQHPSQGMIVLCAACLLAMVLGSVHAFSVFLFLLETQFSAPRAAASLTYSFSLVALTLGVMQGYRVYGRLSAAWFVIALSLLASAGALVAGAATSLWIVWLGYSVMFGAANGLGYGFGLQLAAQCNLGREGMAMGVVTAAYALGAALSPALFDGAMRAGGFASAMTGLAVVLVIVGVISAILLHLSKAHYQSGRVTRSSKTLPARDLMLLWLGYFGGVACGLMAIGHAVGVATALGYTGSIWVAPSVIAVSSLIGSLIAGQMIDKFAPRKLLMALPALSVLSMVGLALSGSSSLLIPAFALIGFAYGGIIAAYPAAIAKLYGANDSARFYGQVFTAWGTAGLCAPWLAGLVYDVTGTYLAAQWIAGGLGAVSVAASWVYFARR